MGETNMNWKVLLLIFVLADFGAYTAYAILEVGYLGIFQAGIANLGAGQIAFDLVIACGLACIWMIHDARERGTSAWPFVVITLFAGSFGPLLYLLRREWDGAPQPASQQA